MAQSDATEQVVQLECNLDDMTGEELGFVLEQLLAAGALDAWFTPIYMKKSRPAVLLGALCRPEHGEALRDLLLKETTTLGVRWQTMERQIAERRHQAVETPWGVVRCKIKIVQGAEVSVKPEYEDCARLARENGLSLRQVTEAAELAFREGRAEPPTDRQSACQADLFGTG
jgi:hypothetical protein